MLRDVKIWTSVEVIVENIAISYITLMIFIFLV